MSNNGLTLEDAMRLARFVRQEIATGVASVTRMSQLCDFILSGNMKREIENAAHERAATLIEKRDAFATPNSYLCELIRALIQPPSAEPSKHEDREG